MHLRFLIIGIIGLACLSLSAQEKEIIFRGKLVSQSDGKAVRYAHIIITNKNVGLSSNIDGEFGIYTAINDSLKISAIGYKSLVFIIQDSINLDKITVFEMIPLIYELAVVEITPYLTYAELRDAIVNHVKTDEEIQYEQIKNYFKKILKYRESSGVSGIKIGGPVSFIYSVFGKYASSQRKFRKLKIEYNVYDKVARKYNPEIVGHLTGMKDKALIEKFMNFCNLPDEYILEVTEIELYKNLLFRYDAFLENQTLN